MNQKFLAFGCPHVPLQDPDAKEWLCKQIADQKPDVVVCTGDLFEANAASRWPSEYSWDLEYEYEEAGKYLRDIRLAHEGAKPVLIAGNHDANIMEWDRISKGVRSLVDPRKRVPELDKWHLVWDYEYDPGRDKGIFAMGPVLFHHGYEMNDEMSAILQLDPYGLLIGSHTHKPRPVTQAMRTKHVPLPYWYANVGCMRDLKPRYVKRKRTHLWGQACVVGEVNVNAKPQSYRDYGLHAHPEWEAETLYYRMAGERRSAA